MNANYFTTAPKLEQAYYLGILAGSANLKRDGNIIVSIPATKRAIIEELREQFAVAKKLSVSIRDNIIILEMKSEEMCRDLRRYGFHTTDKFYIQTEWPRYITFHEDQFLHGYFDVCGEWSMIDDEKYNLHYPQWKLTGYDSMLVSVQSLLRRSIQTELTFLGPLVQKGDLYPSIRIYGNPARKIMEYTHSMFYPCG